MKGLNLYAKISLMLLVVVTIPTVLLGYLSYTKSYEQLQTVTDAFMQDNLLHNAERMNAMMEQIRRQSEKILESEKLKALLREPVPQDKLAEYDFVRQMNPLISELKGDFELSIYPLKPPAYPNYSEGVTGEEEWFRQALALEGQGFWTTVPGRAADMADELWFVRAIRDFPILKPLGVIAFRIPSYVLANQLVIPERLEKVSFYVIDELGRTIISKNTLEPAVAPFGKLPPWDTLKPGTIRLTGTDGQSYYTAFRTLNNEGWGLMEAVPAAVLTGPVENIKRFTLISVVTGLTVMAVLLLVIVRMVTIPLKSLSRHMRRMMGGELVYYEQDLERKDEIGLLVRGYNAMITGMAEHIGTIRQIEEEKRRLEIRTLIHQINPHFLYNTMNAIKWRAEKAGEGGIASMVTSLAELLRFSIHSGEELTTLERELTHVKNYLSIEQQRTSESFSVFVQVQPAVLRLPYMKLTIQPIVENAVKHAMKRQEGDGSGKIMISVSRTAAGLVCAVEDNGTGSSVSLTEHFARLEREGESGEQGVGLYNVDRRLKLRFGSLYGIAMENRPEGGCRVTLLHPVLNEQGEVLQEPPQNVN
ncbi:MAG: histidine kinase [Paenibacillaceae bacterium]|jgi:sensor histidine kinase YesM|nr:histidine kinase [Paenibacillaceae bacterium]